MESVILFCLWVYPSLYKKEDYQIFPQKVYNLGNHQIRLRFYQPRIQSNAEELKIKYIEHIQQNKTDKLHNYYILLKGNTC